MERKLDKDEGKSKGGSLLSLTQCIQPYSSRTLNYRTATCYHKAEQSTVFKLLTFWFRVSPYSVLVNFLFIDAPLCNIPFISYLQCIKFSCWQNDLFRGSWFFLLIKMKISRVRIWTGKRWGKNWGFHSLWDIIETK